MTTFELDIAITDDGVLVVHHDLVLNPAYARDASGRWLDKASAPIHPMSWAELPGANIGNDAAIFEAVHGSAPDIAGKGLANRIALLLATATTLDHCKLPNLAIRLRQAIDETPDVDKMRSCDLGGNASTRAFTKALTDRIKNC